MSIRYLSIPDFHFSTAHINESIMCGKAVAEAARKHEVDFIAVPGDWFDRPIIANNKGGIKAAKMIMRSWLDVCPVCAIEGTVPRHDSRGCYGIFEDMGLVLLQAEKVYGYFEKTLTSYPDIEELAVDESELDIRPDCIIFGTPELTKDNIQSVLNLSAEQANAEAIKQFDNYVTSFMAPMRMKYRDIPAIGLFHGNFTDSVSKETETDRILKRSEILISTEVLEKADLDYLSLGHIHTPWISKKIPASYAGSPGFTWNEQNFVPAFEMIEMANIIVTTDQDAIDHTTKCGPDNPIVTRLPYGTPERRKTYAASQIKIDPNIAYWLESDTDELPEGIHPWSRKTDPQKIKETQRITEEQARDIKSLWDLFKLIDPEVNDNLKSKVDMIVESTRSETGGRLDIKLQRVKITGCDFFSGNTVELNADNLPAGLTLLHGEIGSGKSSLLSFCTPYPVVIGKETKSGRASAIKDFFSSQESKIEKTFIVNGEEHQHIIDISRAHTQTPKVECYLNINGRPQLDRGTFDDMLAECEKLYGPLADYSLTTFYEQPQQSTKNQSGLMTCGRTEARNTVQNIAGVNREQEKRFALDKAKALDDDCRALSVLITAKEEMLGDREALRKQSILLAGLIAAENMKLQEKTCDGNEAKTTLDALKTKQAENNRLLEIKSGKEKEFSELLESQKKIAVKISEYTAAADSLDRNKKILADYDQAKIRIDELQKQKNDIQEKNNSLKSEYLDLKSKYQELVSRRSGCESLIKNARDKIETLRTMIDQASQPCEKCGHIQASAQEIIDQYSGEIKQRETEIKDAELNMFDLPAAPLEPVYQIFDDHELNNLLAVNHIDINEVRQEIEIGIQAQARIQELNKQLDNNNTAREKLASEIGAINIDLVIDEQVRTAEINLETIRNEYSTIREEIVKLKANIENTEKQIQQIEESEKEITDMKTNLGVYEHDLQDWQYIATMLNPDKIPALELEIIIGGIDKEATRTLSPFMDGRYAFRTITQDMGKKSTVDRFDIIIHDAVTGEEKSMFFKNPGHKSFFSDSYIKALIKKRKEKAMISYSPIIMDEADGPISPEQIPVYYEIQNEYFRDEKVLIVSHSSDAQQFIPNVIEIEELKK